MVKWCAISSKDDYCAVQKNSVPAGADAVATSRTVFLLNRVHVGGIDPVESFIQLKALLTNFSGASRGERR